MADAQPRRAGVIWFVIIAILVHAVDAFVRYGSTPASRPGIWITMLFPHFIVYLWATKQPFFADISTRNLIIVAIAAYVWGPFLSILPHYFPALKIIVGAMLMFAPFWVLVAMFRAPESWFSRLYIIFWMGLVLFAFHPNIQDFAEQKGTILPGSMSPMEVIKYSLTAVKTAAVNFYQITFVKIPKKVSEEFKRSLAMASGDYYTGKVDQGAQKRLGVYLENFRPAEQTFYESIPVTAYATMKAETLDIPLDINVGCEAKQQTVTLPVLGTEPAPIPASKILPQNTFNVITTDQYDIDCIWDKGVLKKGTHDLKMKAEFPFTTRAYLKTYVMDRDRLREYRRQNVDPLADVPDKNPAAVYTSGPVRIGMGIGQQQPIALGQQGETLQPWGITIQNSWEGRVVEVTGVTLLVPKGLKISDAGDLKYTESTCAALPQEEQPACDESLVTIYAFTPEELAKEDIYKNLTIKNIRIYLQITDPQKVLGTAPIAVQNFKVSVQYRYLLERTTIATVKEATAQ